MRPFTAGRWGRPGSGFDSFAAREVRPDRVLVLEHGKPMIFAKDRDKGIRLRGVDPEVVTLGQDGVTEKDLLVHDEKAPEPTLAYLLSRMTYPEFPVPVGVFYSVEKPTLEETIQKQGEEVTRRFGPGDIEKLMRGTETWTVS